MLGLFAVFGFVAVTAVTALFTVTAVAITPQKHLEQLLPADTLAFFSVDASSAQLSVEGGRISAWATERLGRLGLRAPQPQDGSTCLESTEAATASLPQIGSGTTIALLPPSRQTTSQLHRGWSRSRLERTVIRNTVVIAPLDIQLTLPMALTHHNQLPAAGAATESYRGVRIFHKSVPACRTNRILPATYYAATFQGYVVLSCRLSALEAIIDTGDGHRPSISSNRIAGLTLSRFRSEASGSFYIHGDKAAKRVPGLSALLNRAFSTEYLAGRHELAGSFIVELTGQIAVRPESA